MTTLVKLVYFCTHTDSYYTVHQSIHCICLSLLPQPLSLSLSPSLFSFSPPLPLSPLTASPEQRGCCWKTFHTDVNGKWWKPHKAGPITAILLVIGWILFIVFFGWIVLMALILVAILICFSYCCNFICTGKCQIEDEESQLEQVRIPTTPGGTESNWRPPVTTDSIMNQLQEQQHSNNRAQQ